MKFPVISFIIRNHCRIMKIITIKRRIIEIMLMRFINENLFLKRYRCSGRRGHVLESQKYLCVIVILINYRFFGRHKKITTYVQIMV